MQKLVADSNQDDLRINSKKSFFFNCSMHTNICYRHLEIIVSLEDWRFVQRLYPITCLQVDEEKFPTRKSFGQIIEAEFNAVFPVVKADHWSCCRELHQDGGVHYHWSIKLTRN